MQSEAALEAGRPAAESKQVFVIGCPRSGTTWVSLLLGHHPALAVLQHSKFFHHLRALELWWKRRDRGWGRSVVVISESNAEPGSSGEVKFSRERRGALSEAVFYGLTREFAAHVFDEVVRAKPGAIGTVSQTPENTHQADLILHLFPDAYFLHVVRDPRAVFCSLRSAGGSWARREFPTRPIDGARFWRQEVEAARGIAGATERYREVRYESLIEGGAGEIQEVFAWLGLAAGRDLCERAVADCRIDALRAEASMPEGFFRRGAAEGWRQELSRRDARLIEHVAGDVMESLGYRRSCPPYRRPPRRLWLDAAGERALAGLDRNLGRASRYLLRKWIGRDRDIPELVIR